MKHAYYFLGIGGISMSGIARYFALQGHTVAGYDRTPSALTQGLEDAGVAISFEDAISSLPESLRAVIEGHTAPSDSEWKVVYTPAVPTTSALYQALAACGLPFVKRAVVLAEVSAPFHTLAVAGTHGKTTTSTLLAHLFAHANSDPLAFLGGVATGYQSNLLAGAGPVCIVEADEYDRSFLQLHPHAAIITSADPDHLDVYGDANAFAAGFAQFAAQVSGRLLVRAGIAGCADLLAAAGQGVQTLTYGYAHEGADIQIADVQVADGRQRFSLHLPEELCLHLGGDLNALTDMALGLPGRHNVENAAAAATLALLEGLSAEDVRAGLESFAGVQRRFQVHFQDATRTYIDDYAHHPAEITALVSAARELYPDRRLVGIFQPHLYSRTRDFADAFAEALAPLDELILLPIYPARETALVGVSSDMLLPLLTKHGHSGARVLAPEAALAAVHILDFGVLLTIGAGDIDRLVGPIADALKASVPHFSFTQNASQTQPTLQ